MNKKINKKLLNLIALCSGITATVGLGIGGVIYSLRQEKVEQNILPESVYKFSDDGKMLLGFQDAFLNDPTSPIYKDNFKNCDTMQIPAKVEIVFPDAFNSSESEVVPVYIKKITFAEGSNCSSIGSNAFFHCPYLTSIDFSNVTELNLYNSCFAECSSLKTIYSPSGLQGIGGSAFQNDTALETITLPETLTTIDKYAFKNCTSLTSVSFPKSLATINENVFQNCGKLNSITWDAWNGNTNLSSTSFSGVSQTRGTVTVTNPSGHDSDELLQYLLNNGGLPSTWAKN